MYLITLLVNKQCEDIDLKTDDYSQQKQLKNLQDQIRQVKLGEKSQSSLPLNIGAEVWKYAVESRKTMTQYSSNYANIMIYENNKNSGGVSIL